MIFGNNDPSSAKETDDTASTTETVSDGSRDWCHIVPGIPWIKRFDSEWYLLAYPEVGLCLRHREFKDALDHYLTVGGSEGLNPNIGFDEHWYRSHYEDVAAGIEGGLYSCGFHHFVLHGYDEGRHANSLPVNEDWYLATYKDAAKTVESGEFPCAHTHFCAVGIGEQRDPNPAFSETWYRQTYKMVDRLARDRLILCGFQYFLARGEDLGHRPHPRYVEEYYARVNPDVRQSVYDGFWRSGYRHLFEIGLIEERNWRIESPRAGCQRAVLTASRTDLHDFLTTASLLKFTTPGKPQISIVIVLFNQAELTLKCLESLKTAVDVEFEVIIVDNASSDLTGRLLDRVDGAKIVRNETNQGFILGANLGAEASTAPNLLFLNNDTVIRPTTLLAALRRLESAPNIGAVGARVVFPDGSIQEAGSVVWSDGTVDPFGHGDDPTAGCYLFPRTVDYCTGAFLLVQKDAFAGLGGFREDYLPAYYEDVDLCFRLRSELGLDTVYEPGAIVHHFHSASDSGKGQASEDLARANRIKFLHLNAQALARQPDWQENTTFGVSDRSRNRPNILVIDDFVPLDKLGSGCPRMREIISALVDLGYFVTLFTTNLQDLVDADSLKRLPNHALEIVNHLGRPGFKHFWHTRRGSYEHVIVSRPHNMHWISSLGLDLGSATLVYDAEALVAHRNERQAQILDDLPDERFEVSEDEELRLCAKADAVWAVSSVEADALSSVASVQVVGHAEDVNPTALPFRDRSGLAFVGRIHEEGSPNVDGLRWFLEQVLPRVSATFGSAIPVTVAGLRSNEIEFPEAPDIRFLGQVDDLESIFNKHRLFIAPARFAAGIPLKVVTAAAYGLPTIASSVLVRQLGWQPGLEISDGGQDDPEKFSSELVEIYSNGSRWGAVREGALRRVVHEHSRDTLRASIESSLKALSNPARSWKTD